MDTTVAGLLQGEWGVVMVVVVVVVAAFGVVSVVGAVEADWVR